MRLPLAVPPTSLPSIGHWGFWETYKSIIIICQLYLFIKSPPLINCPPEESKSLFRKNAVGADL